MGFSGGKDYQDLDGNQFHLEAKDRGVAIWSKNELKRFLFLTADEARELANDLLFHASMSDGKPNE